MAGRKYWAEACCAGCAKQFIEGIPQCEEAATSIEYLLDAGEGGRTFLTFRTTFPLSGIRRHCMPGVPSLINYTLQEEQ